MTLMLCVSQSRAVPLLSEPKFSQVSTSQGLSQDTVNAILIDKQGFLWLGTEGGLNRFDGYQVQSINGSNNALQEIAVLALHQDKNDNIWISSGAAGVFVLNIKTSEVTPVGDWRFKYRPEWRQYASHIIEGKDNRVWLGMNEKVLAISPDTLEVSTVFELDDSLILEEHFIRQIWVDEEVLLVGTSNGLFAVDLSTGTSRQIDFLTRVPVTEDRLNTKYLNVDSANELWIGTVDGLFSMSYLGVKAMLSDKISTANALLRIPQLNIWKMSKTSEDQYLLGTDQGLFNYSPTSDQLQHLFKLTDSRLLLTDDDIVDLVADKNQNLWLGTLFDGALHWSPRSTRFTNVINANNQEKELSNNNVWSFYQQNEMHLWVGTDNGLNLYDLESGEIQAFLVNEDTKAVFSSSSIEQIIPADEHTLWLVTGFGLKRFNTQTKQFETLPTSSDQSKLILEESVWGVTKDQQDNLWFVNDEGIFIYDATKGNIVPFEAATGEINLALIDSVSVNEQAFPNSILINEEGKLWRYDLQTAELVLIHQLPHNGMQHIRAPDTVSLDRNGILWIAYPGFGLYGLDADSYEQKYHFDRNNLLPSNAIYGLQNDLEGNIWMSSHQGIQKFYPENQHIQKFSYAEGLSTLEFNQGAAITLSDNRIVFGSPKGIILFNPAELSNSVESDFNVSITSLSVSSSDIQMPLQDLSGMSVELEQFDVGITISFSTLTFDHQKNTRYDFTLVGDSELSFPTTRDPFVTFSRLEPGSYTFIVKAFDPVSGGVSGPATLNIKVKYAYWASPLAYSIYVALLSSILGWWWYRRNVHNRKILLAHNEVLKSKNRLSLALKASNSNVWEWKAISNTIYAPRILSELGFTELGNEVSFNKHKSLIHPQDKMFYEAQWQAFLNDPEPGLDVTYRLKAISGEWLWFRDVGRSVGQNQSVKERVVAGTYSNITENLANIEKVRLFGEAFKHTRDWVVIFDNQYVPVAVNQALCDVFQIDEHGDLQSQLSEVFGVGVERNPRFWDKLIHLKANEHWKGEEHLLLNNGRTCDVLINMTPVASMRAQGEVDYYLMIMSDISEQKEAENELRHMANFDSLTNLPNRTLLLDRIKHGIDHAIRHKGMVGLFFIDLDKFKQVNDSLGHKAGDELLKVVAQRLIDLLRQDDTVARLGGDEFVVMVEEVKDADKLSVLAKEIISVIESPIQLGNQTVSVSSSVGIAVFPADAGSSEELLRNADVAMYHAKEQGRSHFQYFTEHMNKRAQARLVLENQLKNAHQQKQFSNFYQPIVNINTGRVEGFELLMRWQTEDGMIPPDTFIPVAEELGLIEDMTWDALERAMPVLSRWQHDGNNAYLSVNLSARHFEHQISIEHIIQLLLQHQLSVSSLRFEITESALMRDYERALEYMQNMQKQGFVIALDDFGTGYSSLKYLKEFPIQVLKVDKSFVDDIGKGDSNEALVLTTLRMAESLNMYCVAEGIEEQHQIDFFKQHGCDFLQGYFFSKPVPEEHTIALLGQSWLA